MPESLGPRTWGPGPGEPSSQRGTPDEMAATRMPARVAAIFNRGEEPAVLPHEPPLPCVRGLALWLETGTAGESVPHRRVG